MAKYCICVLWLGVLCVSSVTGATPPSESLLPATTKGYLSVPDVETLRARWNATQLGHLVNDPVMKPFVEDLRDQIKDKLSATRVRLGLTLDDLDDLYGGELCLAVIQPENDVEQHAIVLLLDVTGRREQAEAMLAKVSRNLLAQGATRRVEKVGSADVAVFTMPRAQPDSPVAHAWMVLDRDLLIATDHGGVCEQIVQRVDGGGGETLGEQAAFAPPWSGARGSGRHAPPGAVVCGSVRVRPGRARPAAGGRSGEWICCGCCPVKDLMPCRVSADTSLSPSGTRSSCIARWSMRPPCNGRRTAPSPSDTTWRPACWISPIRTISNPNPGSLGIWDRT